MTSRKRHRISVVCGFCKKRKVKCDKGNPCSTCIKYGNMECHYDIQGVDVVSNKVNDAEYMVQGELQILKAKIRNLEETLTTSNESYNEDSSIHNSRKTCQANHLNWKTELIALAGIIQLHLQMKQSTFMKDIRLFSMVNLSREEILVLWHGYH